MAVGNIDFPEMKLIRGVRLNAVAAGIRYQNRDDLALIELCEGSVAAGCFTQNLYKAAPVIVAQENLAQQACRYLLINSGNANACTGQQGMDDARRSCQFVAKQADVDSQSVLPFSTGVIGEPLNMTAMGNALPDLVSGLAEDQWQKTAKAIMTTDTFAKTVCKDVALSDGTEIRINGIAKGAGMIRPDMATMLAYVVTDACVSEDVVQQICKQATDRSFNRVTVDGDTSTNDSVILAATQKASISTIDSLESVDGQILLSAVIEVFQHLAQLLVRDGEGATKFVTVDVTGGSSTEDCLAAAYAVAHSPLVKTALFASDPNWGRLVMAIGNSGIDGLDAQKIKVWLDDVLIVEKGGVASSYSEEAGQAVFSREEFCVKIDLGMGDCREQIWTCDFSHEYVSINADYRS